MNNYQMNQLVAPLAFPVIIGLASGPVPDLSLDRRMLREIVRKKP